MRIKKLEVVGFKSFLEKTSFHFNVPITAIVGPNGCGKSNVVDALKWVTGELSFKELRGRSMEDLIFAGSETRPPIGMMEVMLTLDNPGGAGPPQFNEFSEITILRRIFRDGSSDFTINKIPCRLHDIIDLFLDTGIGQSSYSIIEQGKVGEIVSGRPEDRRLVIEEAAGITKFKHRKKAAQRKMEYTKQNLLRITDVLGELKRQIGSLERQARLAEKFRKARDEARTLDVALAARDFLEIERQKHLLEKSETELTGQWESEGTEFLAKEAMHEKVRLELLESEKALEEAQNTLFSHSSSVSSLEAKIEAIRREIVALQSTAESERQRVRTLSERRAFFARQTEQIQSQLTLLETDLSSVNGTLGDSGSRLNELQSAEEEAGSELEQKKNALLQVVAREAALRNQLETAEQRLTQVDLKISNRQQELQRTREELSGLEKLYQQQKESLGEAEQLRIGFQKDRDTTRDRLGEMTQRRERAAGDLGKLRPELEGHRARLKTLEEFTRTYQGYRQGVRAVMEKTSKAPASVGRVLGLLGELVHPKRGYERAVQAALSEWIECIVVVSAHDALKAVDFLKGEGRGRGAFLPRGGNGRDEPRKPLASAGVIGWLSDYVSAQDDLKESVDLLLSGILLVQDLPTAVSLRENGVLDRMVTPGGDLLTREGIIVGGTWNEERGVLEVKKEIEELQETLRKGEARKKELEGVLAKLAVQIGSAEQELTRLDQGLEKQGQKAFSHEKDSHRLEETLRYVRENVRVSESEMERLVGEKLDLQNRIGTLCSSHVALGIEKQDHERAQGILAERLASARAEVTRQNELLTSLKVRQASLLERQEAFTRESQSLAEQDREALTESARLAESSNLHERDAEAKRGEIQHLDGERRVAIERHQDQQKVNQKLRSDHDHRAAQIQTGDTELKKLREQRDQISEKLNTLRIKVREEVLRSEHLAEQILERHGVRLAGFISQTEFVPMEEGEIPAARTQLQELREKMAKIGDVNLASIDELRQLKERHDFLTSQKEDLEKSLEALAAAIRKINSTTRERFLSTFEAVNEKFQQVFPRMFGGGKARLFLIEPENILETGVDIVAQPPGKKLQNMNLLSGGEKALTAIALLFAIFEHKAPPFCVLDEVDAPLDDVNIRRFMSLVRHMSERIQFIMITHNKVTMEGAENLYGITMEEPGVSRVVSVRVHQVADVAERPESESLQARSVA